MSRANFVVRQKYWAGLDSNQRKLTLMGLQPIPFSHSGTDPDISYCVLRIAYCVMRIGLRSTTWVVYFLTANPARKNPVSPRILCCFFGAGRLVVLYKTAGIGYDSLLVCRCSSMVERSFRKAEVVGPTPTIGCMALEQKYNQLQQILKGLGKVVIAYSGGVDSTFLLKAAVDTLGAGNVLACIGVSASLAQSQYAQALECAKIIGAEVQEVQVDEVADSKYSANKADRCFHCKSHLFNNLIDIARKKSFNHVLCGSNFDDEDDYRPGNRAARALNVRCPLMEAELTKADIRQLSRDLDLPTADVPASPCLASRVAYGLEITEGRLKQIELAEDFLRQMGFVEFRVRHHDKLARIEVDRKDIEKITAEPARSQIVEKLKSLGFKFVAVDLQGFRSGSLNESLSEAEKQKNL